MIACATHPSAAQVLPSLKRTACHARTATPDRSAAVPPFWNLSSLSELNESQIRIFIWKETSHAKNFGRCRFCGFHNYAQPCGLLHRPGADHEAVQDC
jgi:hypothetical protein